MSEYIPGFTAQNKVLPGTYLNFISALGADSTLSVRGYAALGLPLDFGAENAIITLRAADFAENCRSLFGHAMTDDAMLPLREAFCHANTLLIGRTDTSGTAASCVYGQALYTGARGNALTLSVQSADGGFRVTTLLDGAQIETQTAATVSELRDNCYIHFSGNDALAAGLYPLSGGTNGTDSAAGHAAFLTLLESHTFNAVGYAGTDSTVKALYTAFARRMRDTVGLKCQVVLYREAADYEGVVSLWNSAGDDNGALVYWLTGVVAGEQVNASSMNRVYDGALSPDAELSRSACEAAITAGHMVLRRLAGDCRIVNDENSLRTGSADKGSLFRSNQTIRVIDRIACDTAALFRQKYMGVCPNDNAGRISLWTDIVKQHKVLCDMRAIDAFDDSNIVITRGAASGAVVITDCVTVTGAMEKLYMTCYID